MLFHVQQGLYSQAVAVQAKAANHSLARRADGAMAAELLALVHIADMHLYHRGAHALDGIHQCQAVVGVCPGIQDYTVQFEPNFVYLVYQFAFHVALVVVYADVGECVAQHIQILLKPFLSVYFGFSGAQQVQIGSVDNLDSHNKDVYLRAQRYKKKQLTPSISVGEAAKTQHCCLPGICSAKHKNNTMPNICNTGNVSQDIIKRYIQYLRLERSYSTHTLDAYCRDLQKLFNFYSDNGIEFRNVTLNELDLFAGSLRDKGIAARSIARILSGVRSFYRFLSLEKEIEQDPTELMESPKIGKHLPQVLTVDEIDQILDAIDLSKPEGTRDHCIIEVLYSCGLRISELIDLRISNLFLDEGFIRIHGKGKKERLVPISPRAIRELHNWFEVRRHIDIKRGYEDHVFVSRTRGKALSRISLFVFIQNYAANAGITKEISPHTFRHSFATHLVQGGANLRAIQEMLGHENLGTTEIYMHLDTTHLREQILAYHPRSKKKRPQNT